MDIKEISFNKEEKRAGCENTPELETERLLLRKFTDRDIDDMLLLYGDEDVNKFLPWFPLRTREEVIRYLHNVIYPVYKKDIAYTYAITQKQDDRVIGYVHVNDIGDSNDIGYALRREFWHRGITSEAAAAVIAQMRKNGLPYVTATHDVNNPYSGEVMKKIGMTYRYSYEEQWQPKGILVTFRMYQLNLDGKDERIYRKYWDKYDVHYVENV